MLTIINDEFLKYFLSPQIKERIWPEFLSFCFVFPFACSLISPHSGLTFVTATRRLHLFRKQQKVLDNISIIYPLTRIWCQRLLYKFRCWCQECFIIQFCREPFGIQIHKVENEKISDSCSCADDSFNYMCAYAESIYSLHSPTADRQGPPENRKTIAA